MVMIWRKHNETKPAPRITVTVLWLKWTYRLDDNACPSSTGEIYDTFTEISDTYPILVISGYLTIFNLLILTPLKLFVLSIIVLQAMTNPFTLKTINGIFEMISCSSENPYATLSIEKFAEMNPTH
ncbi:hypothetical protein llap_4403 [Limosa lapponica baueri]|uniref:Uncharacterized protein n=1 Tax=Limosa lapponica baueri TaxID=1758121 RepID=A0A2I0UGZ5_LIMLA|nr:hypothetical protein llap_4403 [Limosa lapponica baueri]